MFEPRARGRRQEKGRDGPMRIPHGEVLRLRSLADDLNAPAPDVVVAKQSPLSLSDANNESRFESAAQDFNAAETEDAGNIKDTNNTEESATVENGDSVSVGDNSAEGKGPPLPTTLNAYIMSQGATDPSTPPTEWFGEAMEYAAGVALRTKVLRPVLAEYSGLSDELLAEAPRFLGIYSRGEFLLIKGADGVHQGSIERVMHEDGPSMAMWWEGDKFLSYTDQDWSDWWIRRCHLFDPGCEMVKLINELGDTLGVAYYERNVIDKHQFGNKGRITLIRGIRVSPEINAEVFRRGDLTGSLGKNDPIYKGIASLLFSHILFNSVRYGSSAVGVNSPKNEVAEHFYESFMGPAVDFDIGTGRRYYRISSQSRWNVLQQSFRRQVGLWIQQREGPGANGRSQTHRFYREGYAREAVANPSSQNEGNGQILNDTESLNDEQDRYENKRRKTEARVGTDESLTHKSDSDEETKKKNSAPLRLVSNG